MKNKKKYVMSYLDYLAIHSVYDKIEVGFVPVGNTHSDIDQAFSPSSRNLDTQDAVTLSYLHYGLDQSYNDLNMVTTVNKCLKRYKLCQEDVCIENINDIFSYKFFKFEETTGNS